MKESSSDGESQQAAFGVTGEHPKNSLSSLRVAWKHAAWISQAATPAELSLFSPRRVETCGVDFTGGDAC